MLKKAQSPKAVDVVMQRTPTKPNAACILSDSTKLTQFHVFSRKSFSHEAFVGISHAISRKLTLSHGRTVPEAHIHTSSNTTWPQMQAPPQVSKLYLLTRSLQPLTRNSNPRNKSLLFDERQGSDGDRTKAPNVLRYSFGGLGL